MSRSTPVVITFGAHVLDTHVYPVESIPDGQGGQLVDRITVSAAGPAGGTAMVLSRLGARVRTVGAVGRDAVGDLLMTLLRSEGVDVELLRRVPEEQTSASVLPIRPDGSRPAFHVLGANLLAGAHVPWDEIARADHLHFGAPELLGAELASEVLRHCRNNGVGTSVDALGPGLPDILDAFAAALPYVDYLLPNAEQALGWTGESDLVRACKSLHGLGARCVAATAGASPTILVDEDRGSAEVAVFPTDVVDTTGAGDAFSAGFVRGVLLGHGPIEAAVMGAAVASHTVRGIGTAAGGYDLGSVLRLAQTHPDWVASIA